MSGQNDLYSVLGVARDSNQAVIQAAYRNLMRRYHPDTNPTAEATARAVEINLAYGVLGQQARREQYDSGRARKTERHARPQPNRPAATSDAIPITPIEPDIVGAGFVQSAIALVLACLMSMLVMYVIELMIDG